MCKFDVFLYSVKSLLDLDDFLADLEDLFVEDYERQLEKIANDGAGGVNVMSNFEEVIINN